MSDINTRHTVQASGDCSAARPDDDAVKYAFFGEPECVQLANDVESILRQPTALGGPYKRFYASSYAMDSLPDVKIAVILLPSDHDRHATWLALTKYLIGLRREVVLVRTCEPGNIFPEVDHAFLDFASLRSEITNAYAERSEHGARGLATFIQAIGLRQRMFVSTDYELAFQRTYIKLASEWAAKIAHLEFTVQEREKVIQDMSGRLSEHHDRALRLQHLAETLIEKNTTVAGLGQELLDTFLGRETASKAEERGDEAAVPDFVAKAAR